jgi:DNA-binding response OmpR family regulator
MAEKPRVMVVEDDPLLADLLAQKFTSEQFDLRYAPTGEAALEMLKSETPDLILLDIMLPGIDGFEVLKQIKENPEKKAVPVIILSNLGQESDIEKGTQLGAEKFIVKVSLTLDEVISLARGVLSKHQ